MDSSPNNDVVTEILLRLPFTSLLRSRIVCKSWRDLIDSEAFRNLHIQRHADGDDDRLLVQFSFRLEGVSEVSMLSRHNRKLYNTLPPASQEILDNHLTLSLDITDSADRCARIAGPAHGLICIYYRDSDAPIAVCNPSLGLITILPPCPFQFQFQPNPSLGHINIFSTWSFEPDYPRDVGIWFDKVARDYLVVQLWSCSGNLHASVYSRATNSWADGSIVGDGLSVLSPIRSSCKNGYFSHWLAINEAGNEVILSFDFRNEGFRILEMNFEMLKEYEKDMEIFEEGDDSFLVFTSSGSTVVWLMWVNICRMTIEGNRLQRHFLKGVGPFGVAVIPKALCERSCVVLQCKNRYLRLWDYYEEKFEEYFEMRRDKLEILEYRGSFVLP